MKNDADSSNAALPGAQWAPIRAAPDPDSASWEEHDLYRQDLAERIASLMDRYGCEPSEVGWKRLALRLAIRHEAIWNALAQKLPKLDQRYGEPGFEIAIHVPHRKPQEDERWRWVQMIDKHLPFDPVKSPYGTWTDSLGTKRCSSTAAAAKLVARYLQQEWQTGGQAWKKPPGARHLEMVYGDHKRLRADLDTREGRAAGDPLPEYVEHYIARRGVMDRLMSVPAAQIAACQEHQEVS